MKKLVILALVVMVVAPATRADWPKKVEEPEQPLCEQIAEMTRAKEQLLCGRWDEKLVTELFLILVGGGFAFLITRPLFEQRPPGHNGPL